MVGVLLSPEGRAQGEGVKSRFSIVGLETPIEALGRFYQPDIFAEIGDRKRLCLAFG
jgi:hypothetical protein